jgi:ATP-dependent Clp protease ATP-binding subunit ClpC
VDEIITFKPLSLEDVEKIVELQMKEIQSRLAEHGLSVQLTEAARKWLAKEGYEPAFGARPLRRALQKYIESPLSIQMLRGDFKPGDVVTVDYDEDKGINFSRTGASPAVKVDKTVSVSS